MDFEKLISNLITTGNAMGLARITELLEKLDNPHSKLKVIHVAGTNGKGSTCSMLSSILIDAGYKTALFTSPYIETVNEEFKINNVNISDDKLIAIVKKIEPIVNTMQCKPSAFELRTAIAFEYFKNEYCDVVILEVGLGGLYDATNVIEKPLLSVITKVGIDHISFLGDTIEEIATIKAGIIKQNSPCILMKQDEEIITICNQICIQKNAEIIISQPEEVTINSMDLDGTFRTGRSCINYKNLSNLKIPLIGTHQVENTTLVLKIIEVLNETKNYKITEKNIRAGLESTKWSARFEVLSKNPLFIIDGAHNVAGVSAFTSTLKQVLPDTKCTFIMAVMSDKEYVTMIKQLVPFAQKFVTISLDIPRALSAEDLATEIKTHFDGEVVACETIPLAVETALKISNTPICCVGSLYMLFDVKKAVNNQ